MLAGAENRAAAIEKAFSEGTLGVEPPESTSPPAEEAEEQKQEAASEDSASEDEGTSPENAPAEEPDAPAEVDDIKATEADHRSKKFRDRFNRQIEARHESDRKASAAKARADAAEARTSELEERLARLEGLSRQDGQPPLPLGETPAEGGEGKHWLDELLGDQDSYSQDEIRGMFQSYDKRLDERLGAHDGRIREVEIERASASLGKEIEALREKYPDVEESWVTDAIIGSDDPDNFDIGEFAHMAQGFIDKIGKKAVDEYLSNDSAGQPPPDAPPRPSGTGGGASSSPSGASDPKNEPEGATTIRGRGAQLRRDLIAKFGQGAVGL